MIAKDYSHPSVILYSIGNEVSETAFPQGVETADKLTRFVHALDDTRPVTAGINVLLNVYAQKGIGVYKESGAAAAQEAGGEKERVGFCVL